MVNTCCCDARDGWHRPVFGECPVRRDDLALVERVIDIVQCTGCGWYAGGEMFQKEHACWTNEDGSKEVGGSFQ